LYNFIVTFAVFVSTAMLYCVQFANRVRLENLCNQRSVNFSLKCILLTC